jgi:hypothetical protein
MAKAASLEKAADSEHLRATGGSSVKKHLRATSDV